MPKLVLWMLFDEVRGDVQVYNRDANGDGPRNISVNIHGSNGGNICIDCQSQIQVDAALGNEDSLVNLPDMKRLMGPNPVFPPFYFMDQALKTLGESYSP